MYGLHSSQKKYAGAFRVGDDDGRRIVYEIINLKIQNYDPARRWPWYI